MAFDINNFVIDHVIRGIMASTADGSYMWSINQITDPSLSVTSESTDAVDALGNPIMTFNRSKSAEFTANNSLFDLGLYAAQMGNAKKIGTGAAQLKVPAFETINVLDEASKTLAHQPLEDVTEIFKLNGDGTLGEKFVAGDKIDEHTFVYNPTTYTITYPTTIKSGDQLFVMYDYNEANAVAVVGDAVNFPKAGRFIMEVLGSDVCDPTTLIHAFVEFPNAKLDAAVDFSFTTDGTHPFTIKANQDYCDKEKILFKIVIPQEV